MHQNQPYAQARKRIKVVNELDKFSVGNDFATKSNDKCFIAERIDVRCYRAEPGDEVMIESHSRCPNERLNFVCIMRRYLSFEWLQQLPMLADRKFNNLPTALALRQLPLTRRSPYEGRGDPTSTG